MPPAATLPQSLFRDPVVAADGHSYEREAIEAWLASGSRMGPLTGEELKTTRLFPNRALRAAIAALLGEDAG